MFIYCYSYGEHLFGWSINSNPILIEDCLRKSLHHINFQPLDKINLGDAINIICETKIDNGLHIRITFDFQDHTWQCFLYKSVIEILHTRFEKCKMLENEELLIRVQQQQQIEKENEARINALNKQIQETSTIISITNISTEINQTTIYPTEINQTTIYPIEINQTTIYPTEINQTTIYPTEINQTTIYPTEINQTTIDSNESITDLVTDEILNTTQIIATLPDGDTDDELLIENELNIQLNLDQNQTININNTSTSVYDDNSKLKDSVTNSHISYDWDLSNLKEEDIEP